MIYLKSKYESGSLWHSEDSRVTLKSETTTDRGFLCRKRITSLLRKLTLETKDWFFLCHTAVPWQKAFSQFCSHTNLASRLSSCTISSVPPLILWGWFRCSYCSPLCLPWDTFLCILPFACLSPQGQQMYFFTCPESRSTRYSMTAGWMRNPSEAQQRLLGEVLLDIFYRAEMVLFWLFTLLLD